VVSGVLDEQHLPARASGVVATRRLRAGDALAFNSAHVHAMCNSNDVDAMSVHVYSPPLSTMTFFEQGAGSQLLPRDAALVEPQAERAPLARAAG
jgi:hypothetical protein